MQMLTSALTAYLITTMFAMFIAVVLLLVARGVKRLGLEGVPIEPTPTSPPPVSTQNLTSVAIAIAAAKHKASGQ